MKDKKLRNDCLLSLLGVAAVCFYPLYMGVRVVFDMIKDGTVMKEDKNIRLRHREETADNNFSIFCFS